VRWRDNCSVSHKTSTSLADLPQSSKSYMAVFAIGLEDSPDKCVMHSCWKAHAAMDVWGTTYESGRVSMPLRIQAAITQSYTIQWLQLDSSTKT